MSKEPKKIDKKVVLEQELGQITHILIKKEGEAAKLNGEIRSLQNQAAQISKRLDKIKE